MKKYFVESGPMKATILAEDARGAAAEAVQWWGRRYAAQADHRRGLDELIAVSRRGFGRGKVRRFPTYRVIAQVNGESPREALKRVLSGLLDERPGSPSAANGGDC